MAVNPIDPKSPIPRYYQVYTSLRGRIRDGEFKTGDALPSERQLVEDYGVSRITVVKSLDILEKDGLIERQHGRGNFVTQPPIAIDEPERLKVAVFFPYVIEPIQLFDGLLKGIEGQEVQLQIVGSYSPKKEPWYVQDAIDQGYDGFIFYPVRGFQNEEMYRALLEKQIPFVMVDRYHPHLESDHVIFDDFSAGYQLTEFLIQRGYQKLAVLTSHEVSVTSVRERLRGYRQALEDHNLNYDEELVWLDIYKALDHSPASVPKLAAAYQNLHERIEQYQPAALIAINRLVQEQIVHDIATIRQGKVDFNINVAAFTNHNPCPPNDAFVALALQSDEMLGATAMKLLIDRINGNSTEPPVSKKLPMKIVDLK
jgi:GntR family transcriptional regulator, arabinose operon transcriptional repressor